MKMRLVLKSMIMIVMVLVGSIVWKEGWLGIPSSCHFKRGRNLGTLPVQRKQTQVMQEGEWGHLCLGSWHFTSQGSKNPPVHTNRKISLMRIRYQQDTDSAPGKRFHCHYLFPIAASLLAPAKIIYSITHCLSHALLKPSISRK